MKNKKNIPLIIGMILIFVGTLLPSIRIANENINFIKENGALTIILVAIMYILLKLEKKSLITVPSVLSLSLIIKFMIDNKGRLNEIKETYKCYAGFKYGLAIMIIGNMIVLLSIIIPIINKEKIKEKTTLIIKTIKEKIKTFKQKPKQTKKEITPSIIEKISKKEDKKKISTETTKDGKIKYNKIVVKVDNKPKKEKKSIKEKLNLFLLKKRLKKISRKNISITKFNEQKSQKTYYIPKINIKRWTRNDVCCINCGATVKSTSEYCFLCDCKIKLNDKEEKLS